MTYRGPFQTLRFCGSWITDGKSEWIHTNAVLAAFSQSSRQFALLSLSHWVQVREEMSRTAQKSSQTNLSDLCIASAALLLLFLSSWSTCFLRWPQNVCKFGRKGFLKTCVLIVDFHYCYYFALSKRDEGPGSSETVDTGLCYRQLCLFSFFLSPFRWCGFVESKSWPAQIIWEVVNAWLEHRGLHQTLFTWKLFCWPC